MTAEEMGMSPEAVAYVEAIIARGRRVRHFGTGRPACENPHAKGSVEVARARLRVVDGVGDEEDHQIVKECGPLRFREEYTG